MKLRCKIGWHKWGDVYVPDARNRFDGLRPEETTAVTQEDLDALKGEDILRVQTASTTDIIVATEGCLPPPSFEAEGTSVERVATDVKEI